MEREKIGYRIRELREMHNYTREEMAEMVEISPKFLYEIESGKKGFSSEILCKIAWTWNGVSGSGGTETDRATSEILCKIARKFTVSCDYIMYGEEQSLKISEKMYCILKQVETKQIIKIQSILKLLIEICDAI